MRLAILSDIHGNLPALEAVIADADARGCAGFINLGDILSGPLWPAETAALLMRLDWPTIAGNQERQLLTLPIDRMSQSDRFARAALDEAALAWLAGLPPSQQFSPEIFLCHGTPDSDLHYLLATVTPEGVRLARPEEVRERLKGRMDAIIFCGHSHLPYVLHLPGQVIANPGSVGLPAYADDLPLPHRMEAGTPQARYAILGDGAVELCAVDYDFASAAAKADREGRPDWAIALRTGRVEER